MSDTPRTDAMTKGQRGDWRTPRADTVLADFARELERELAAVTAENAALREWFEFLADTKASFANGFFDGQLRWWLEWGGHLPVLQKDTYATPKDAIKAAIDAAKGGAS